MTDPSDDDLIAALRTLPREQDPPPELQARILAALRRERLLWSRRRWPRTAAAAAVLVATFVSGYSASHVYAPASPAATHMLLVYESPAEAGSTSSERAAEYGQWAGGLAAEQRLAGGEELAPEGWVLDRSRVTPVRQPVIGGYFLLHAADDEAARRIAVTCPHLRYGGRLELRRIRR